MSHRYKIGVNAVEQPELFGHTLIGLAKYCRRSLCPMMTYVHPACLSALEPLTRVAPRLPSDNSAATAIDYFHAPNHGPEHQEQGDDDVDIAMLNLCHESLTRVLRPRQRTGHFPISAIIGLRLIDYASTMSGASPGKFCPSINSRLAPPPVEI